MRLYTTSVGPVVVDVDADKETLSIWQFDGEGRLAATSGDEWAWTDVADLLKTEVGMPALEAERIAAAFLEEAKTQGLEQEPLDGSVGTIVAFTLFGLLLIATGVGIWTIGDALLSRVL